MQHAQTFDRHTQIKAPGAHLVALEWRAPFEAFSSVALWPLLMRGPGGDGHTVLVLPGQPPESEQRLAFLRMAEPAQGRRPQKASAP